MVSSAEPAARPLRIVIIGGGIAGLTAAIALRRAGHLPRVYERAPLLAEVGAGITLWPNAIGALRTIDVADIVISAGRTVAQASILTSAGATLAVSNLATLSQTIGEPTVAIHRARLLEILHRSCEGLEIRTGSEFVRYDESGERVTAHFMDGSAQECDLLIGADGIRSAVRSQMLPAVRLRDSGYAAWRGVVETATAAGTSESWGRGTRFGIVPIAADRTYWFATVNSSPMTIAEPAERKNAIERLFGGWHTPIPELVRATAPESIVYNHIYDIAPLPRWHTPRVVVLGDAIHPTTPNMGQGGGMAIESAVVLADCLADDHRTLAASLEDFEKRRQKRTAWITNQSLRIGRLGQTQNPALCLLRNALVRLTPRTAMEKQLLRAAQISV